MSNYWEEHYRRGGDSGEGSSGAVRDYKWQVISKFSKLQDVIDIGCGDLQLWEGRGCVNYLGLDISPTVIKKNQEKRPDWKFIVFDSSASLPLKADTVLCLEMLFHVLDEQVFIKTIKNLCEYSSNWIFIYTWKENPFADWHIRKQAVWNLCKRVKFLKAFRMLFRYDTDGIYQKYRKFDGYLEIFKKADFTLVSVEQKYDFGAMYVFKRDESKPNT